MLPGLLVIGPSGIVNVVRVSRRSGPTARRGAIVACVGGLRELGHVAKLLIIDERPSQAAFVAYEHLRHEDPIVVEFERFVRARLDEPFNVAFVAQSLGTSRRTLERRVRAALNLTPLGFVQRLRIERARHLSATTDLTSAEIALRVGYANAETLRSLLRRERRRS